MLAPPFPAAAIEAARDAAKAHLRINGTSEDVALAAQCASAMALCEAFTGRTLILRDWSEILPAGSGWQRLSGSPVAVIDDVEGLPDLGERSASTYGFLLLGSAAQVITIAERCERLANAIRIGCHEPFALKFAPILAHDVEAGRASLHEFYAARPECQQ